MKIAAGPESRGGCYPHSEFTGSAFSDRATSGAKTTQGVFHCLEADQILPHPLPGLKCGCPDGISHLLYALHVTFQTRPLLKPVSFSVSG